MYYTYAPGICGNVVFIIICRRGALGVTSNKTGETKILNVDEKAYIGVAERLFFWLFLLSNNLLQVKFKERKPNGSGIWSFRINKQFRALGVFNEDGDLIIFKIDNHQ